MKSLSRVQLFATPWTVAYQASLSVGFSRQEYWSGLPFSSPGDLPDLGIEHESPALRADALPSEPPEKPIVRYKCSLSLASRWKHDCFSPSFLFHRTEAPEERLFSFSGSSSPKSPEETLSGLSWVACPLLKYLLELQDQAGTREREWWRQSNEEQLWFLSLIK